jgi:hypothetical protein
LESLRHGTAKTRFAFQYGVNVSDIAKDDKPHDCDWLKAPIGDKECHYDAEAKVLKVRTALDQTTGRPIVSYDDDAWSWDSSSGSYTPTLTDPPPPGQPSPGPYVVKTRNILSISWKRIEE